MDYRLKIYAIGVGIVMFLMSFFMWKIKEWLEWNENDDNVEPSVYVLAFLWPVVVVITAIAIPLSVPIIAGKALSKYIDKKDK